MNSATAKSIFAAFTPDEKEKAKQLKATGLPPLQAIRQVHAAKIGDAAREGQPDLDAAESDPSTLENVAAFGQGVARSAALGLDDEAKGAAYALAEPIVGPLSGRAPDVGGAYVRGRDDQREKNAATDQFAPGAVGHGEFAGTVAQAFLPGGKIKQIAQKAPRVGRAILEGFGIGAAQGGATGFGEDEGSVVENTITGAGVGGLIGGGVAGVGNVAANAASRKAAKEAAEDLGAGAKRSLLNVNVLDLLQDAPGVGKMVGRARRAWRGAPPSSVKGRELAALDDVTDNSWIGGTDAPSVDADGGIVGTPVPSKTSPLPARTAEKAPGASTSNVPEYDEEQIVAFADNLRTPEPAPPAPGAADDVDDGLEALVDATTSPGATDDIDIDIDVADPVRAAQLPRHMRPGRVPPVVADEAPAQGFTTRPSTPAPESNPRNVAAAKEQARASPTVDNVSGRQGDQVGAINQGAEWKAAYDATPSGERGAFIARLIDEGTPAEVVRRRLGLTKAEWRRASFDRSAAQHIEDLQSLQENP